MEWHGTNVRKQSNVVVRSANETQEVAVALTSITK